MFENLPPLLQTFLLIIPSTFMALFHVVNPIGSGVLFLGLTPNTPNALRKQMARKIAFNSGIILMFTVVVGIFIMKLFGITIPIVQMCGGTMILTMGWRSLQQDDSVNESDKKKYLSDQINVEDHTNKVFYPYTFPFTVGPGSIAVALTISAEGLGGKTHEYIMHYTASAIAIVLIMLSIYICFSSADYFVSKASEQARRVIMKILSFVLLCIGGQIIMNGVTEFVKTFM